jgi:hypothetical protein
VLEEALFNLDSFVTECCQRLVTPMRDSS